MRLIPDWRLVARKAWSIKLALIAAALGGLELLLQFLTPAQPSGRFIAAAVVVNICAALARVVAQPKLRGDDE
ncbi:MAG: hypothetical protein EOP39_04665 [Rubrivivax sp.]|nr:MAG: hypothetical protein EOP39_04665 [Rubrivivax sp.]